MSLKQLQNAVDALSKNKTPHGLRELIRHLEDIDSVSALPMRTIGLLVREMTLLAESRSNLLNGNFLPFFLKTYDFTREGIKSAGGFISGRKSYPPGYDASRVAKLQAHMCENAGRAAKSIYLEYKRYADANDPKITVDVYLGWVPFWERYSRAAAYLFLKSGCRAEAAFNHINAGDACAVWHQNGRAGYMDIGKTHYATALRILASEARRNGVRNMIDRATKGLAYLKS